VVIKKYLFMSVKAIFWTKQFIYVFENKLYCKQLRFYYDPYIVMKLSFLYFLMLSI